MENLSDTPIVGVPYFDEDRFVSPWNSLDGVQPPTTKKQVYIHDVTLRDGGQTPGVVWRPEERIRIAVALSNLGVEEIEVGMPIVPDVKEATRALLAMDLKAKIVPFARARQDDIDATVDAGASAVVVEHCLNPYLNKYVYGLTKEGLIERVLKWVTYAKDQGLRTTFMGWDVTRASFDFVFDVYRQVVQFAHPDALVITDSFGVATPQAIHMAVSYFKAAFPDIPLELHIHNEFGLAMGSVFAAVAAGIDGVHTSMNGLGERTGNVPTEEVAAALEILLGIQTGIDLSQLGSTSRLVQDISKVPMAPNKPVVGSRVFTVESGVVTHIIKEMESIGCMTAMTPYTPDLVGHAPVEFVLGQGTGKHTIGVFLQRAGIHATEEESEEILEIVREEATVRKGLLHLDDLKSIARMVVGDTI